MNKMVLALLMALTISLAGCGSKAPETPADVPAAESAEEAEAGEKRESQRSGLPQ